ncbi:dihydrodipicolinate reductase [Candidatus Woesearchaeota archaeon]|nr:dihydrodipicolinate reductase [Candidatus Woesearchaeota archaeon]
MGTKVMVNGLPGKMAIEVAGLIKSGRYFSDKYCGFDLAGYSLTSSDQTEGIAVGASRDVEPIRPDQREDGIRRLKEVYEGRTVLSVDYTTPEAVNGNADFYCRHGLPFVMGTTGGDRAALEARVRDSDVVAVVAPNMAKQIVALQAMFAYAAMTFPGAFEGYTLEVQESHQAGKKDTSGTAKAMVGYFNELGVPFVIEDIIKYRDPVVQERLIGVPKKHLGGHGWHGYVLNTGHGDVEFCFKHNVNGRRVYAEGTLDALRFLQKKVEAGEKGKVYSMIDVLKGE